MSGYTPIWPAPANVRAYITERSGGHSEGSYASNNLGLHVGDQPERVAENRALLLDEGLGLKAQWLDQVHGTALVEAQSDGVTRRGDGCFTRRRKLACVVLTADCLPVLLCDRRGSQVAAVHGGWRGLAAGILGQAIARFEEPPSELLAYLGPAISQAHYEVGEEVREALARSLKAPVDFALPQEDRPGHYRVDMYAVARQQLKELGVTEVYGGDACTFAEADRFYSYRRDGVTGRMASLIWLK